MTHGEIRIDRFEAHLTKQGLSRTKPRRQVYRVLAAEGPLSLAQIVIALEGQVDRATVYRTVDFFLANDMAIKVGANVELGEAFKPHHHHIVCRLCGKSTTIDDDTLETTIRQAAAATGFRLESHEVELIGLCAGCNAAVA